MTSLLPVSGSLCALLVFFLPLYIRAQPQISSTMPLSSEVEQYGLFEVSVGLNATYSNPFDYDQVRVFATFYGPDSQMVTVDGFYMQDFHLNETGGLVASGQGFKVRFSPDTPGLWTWQVFATDVTGTASALTQTFTCIPRSSPHNSGFARTGPTRYLRTDHEDQLILVGENMCWQNANAYVDYKKWIDKLTGAGGNYFRLWHAHWGLGIEWKNNVSQYQGLRRYQQEKARYQDWLFDYAAGKGVYVMLALQHHGQVSTQVNPNWSESPYNAANGGPCAQTWDFFTDSTAKAHTRNRYRYIVARWGYSRAIMCWELFNEVEWTDSYDLHDADVMLWHAEMAAYLKSIDPYGHLITTSFADEKNDPLVWGNTDIDFTQTHYYINSPNLERTLAGGARRYLSEYAKPTLNGEFGIGASSTLPQIDPDGIHIHNSLWAPIFNGGMGTGMSWWWDIYIEVKNLYIHFEGVSAVASQIPFAKAAMKPHTGLVSGAPGDLSLTPSLGWAGVGTDTLTINADGSITPANYALGTYLYGAQWNTQFRSPPVFVVNYPADGTFTVRTGGSASTSPKITIRLDGAIVLNQNAQTNTSYTINVPAGPHLLKVDNTGSDWVTIASYRFSGLGSKIDAYILKAADGKSAAGWLLSNQYNHEVVPVNGVPAAVTGAQLTLSGLDDSTYFLKWYNCLTGALLSDAPVTVSGGTLTVPVPSLIWDLAFLLDRQSTVASVAASRLAMEFQVYPNPVAAGGILTVERADNQILPATATLLDMGGRQVREWSLDATPQARFTLPSDLAQGFYWLNVRDGKKTGVKPLVVE